MVKKGEKSTFKILYIDFFFDFRVREYDSGVIS